MTAQASAQSGETAIAEIRILRLAVGLALSFACAQILQWPLSFVSAVLVSVLLALPAPAPTLKTAIGFALIMTLSLLLGIQFLPMLLNQPVAGVVLVVLALYRCFYFGARGGPPIVATFLLTGLALIPVIGSESVDAAIAATWGLGINAIVAYLFVWLAFALFPDPPQEAKAAPERPEPPSPSAAAYSALRSTAIVIPPLLWLLMTVETSAYAVVLLKIASMGQQTTHEGTGAVARDLLLSTVVGGVAGVIIWNVLKIWPNLLLYSLLFLLAGLVIGRKIFVGAGLAKNASMWSYGLLTMIIIVVPATMDTEGGAAAGGRFSDRILMFVLGTLYAVAAVWIFDRFWPARERSESAVAVR